MSDPDTETSAGEDPEDGESEAEHEDREDGEKYEDREDGEEYEVERLATRADGAAVLRRLADGVAAGSVELGADGVVATVPERFELEIEYERDDEEAEIEVELEWPIVEGEAVAIDEGTGMEDEATGTDDEVIGTDDEASGETELGNTAHGDEEAEDAEAAADGIEAVVAAGDAAESKARFELFRDRADEWRWRLVHDNGNVIADSGEGYDRKAGARNGLESVMRNAPGAAVVEDD